MKKLSIFLVFALLAALLTVNVIAAYVAPTAITIKKAAAAPAIDGEISEAEWGAPVWSFVYSDGTELGDYGDTAAETWFFYNGDDDPVPVLKKTKVDFYAMWDETYLYFGIVTDNPEKVYPEAMGDFLGSSWQARGIQFEYSDKDGTFTDLGFGIDAAGNSNQIWFMGLNAGEEMKHSVKFTQSGTVVKYEIAMKWADINVNAPSAGSVFPFTLSCNFHSVYDSEPFWSVSLGGSEMTKNPDAFVPATLSGDLAVVAAPEPEPEAPAPEQPAPEDTPAPSAPANSPKTGDAMMIFAVLMLAAGAVIVTKRTVKSK